MKCAFDNYKDDLINWKPVVPGTAVITGILMDKVTFDHAVYKKTYYEARLLVHNTEFPVLIDNEILPKVNTLLGQEVVITGKINSKDSHLYILATDIIVAPKQNANNNNVLIDGFIVRGTRWSDSEDFFIKVPHYSGFHDFIPCRTTVHKRMKDGERVKISGYLERFSDQYRVVVESYS